MFLAFKIELDTPPEVETWAPNLNLQVKSRSYWKDWGSFDFGLGLDLVGFLGAFGGIVG